jgi:prepilin-type processing-associated H-X9-DG protein
MMTRARFAPGFTLNQLIGWTAIILGLTILLYPIFSTPRRWEGHGISCLGNLKQLGIGMLMYTQDWDDTYPAAGASDHKGPGRSGRQSQESADFRSSLWVAQLLPYVKNPQIFTCPNDPGREPDRTSGLVPGATALFPVSYGPNRLFVTPLEYGWKKGSVSVTRVEQPAQKYFLADCATPHGFDLDSIAHLRYPNYHLSSQQNGWTPEQYRAAGRVAWPEKVAEPLTRHNLGGNIAFADGHAQWVRHDLIPNNDGQRGRQYPALVEVMVPWQ